MKTSHKILAAVAALAASTAAQASVSLNFDSLNTVYGDGNPYLGHVRGDGSYLTYSEAGYVFTLTTANGPGTFYGAHIGDAGGSGSFNWHDDGDNLYGAYMTLTRADAGTFSLKSFDWGHSGSNLNVNATGYAPLVLNGGGNAIANFNNVSSVTFSSFDYSYNALDNVVLQGVPEPTSWALMIGGFGLAGAAARRRKTTVSFA